jgi:hypothetical protein
LQSREEQVPLISGGGESMHGSIPHYSKKKKNSNDLNISKKLLKNNINKYSIIKLIQYIKITPQISVAKRNL